MTREGIKAGDLSVLHEQTPVTEVKQRQGPRKHSGDCPKFGACPQPHMMLDYVDARYVMDKLDHLGPENWQDRYLDRAGGSVRCGIGLLIDGEWVWKWDVGTVSDIEPEKGSYSEAFKRAAVKWGVGRDLYGHKPGASAPARTTATRPAVVTPPPATRPGIPAAVAAQREPIAVRGMDNRRQTAAEEVADIVATRDPLAEARAIFDEPPLPPEPAFTPQQIIPPAPHGGWTEGQLHTPGHKPLRARQNGSLFCPSKMPDGGWCPFKTSAA